MIKRSSRIAQRDRLLFAISLQNQSLVINTVNTVFAAGKDRIVGAIKRYQPLWQVPKGFNHPIFIIILFLGIIMTQKRHRILLTEDHKILREGLKALLSTNPDIEVIGEAEDGRMAIKYAQSFSPDLVLMDLSMPKTGGLEAIREIKRTQPEVKIVVLTVHDSDEYVQEALQSGADGYVLKDADRQELLGAINHVLNGKRYLSPGISEKIIEGYLSTSRGAQKTKTAWDSLTHREREILKLIAEGYQNKDIADYLYISLKTVEKHRANLMKKLDIHNTARLTAYAMEKGLITR
jgi:two-component system, NarL family, response regulator NreC